MNCFPLSRPVTTIGRSPQCQVVLSHDGRTSRVHAEIRREPAGFVLYDRGSMNGTYVNNVRVTRQVLCEGDEVRIGRTRFLAREGCLWTLSEGVTGQPRPDRLRPVLLIGAILLVLLSGFVAWQAIFGDLDAGASEPDHPLPTPGAPVATTPAPPTATGTASPGTTLSASPPPPTSGAVAATLTDPTIAATRPVPATATAVHPTLVRTDEVPPTATPQTDRGGAVAGERLVLADYFSWYSGDRWGDCNISSGDRPTEPYDSDDPGAIARHARQAKDAGIGALTLHWVGQGNRTDANFEKLLSAVEGVGLRATIVTEQHFFHGLAAQSDVVGALRYVMERYSHRPGFLRYEGRPVLMFIDMQRVARSAGQTPEQAWAVIRDQVDPGRDAWWIAEGDGSHAGYLNTFDGLYTYKIAHKANPAAYNRASRDARAVRDMAARTGRRKLWLGTIMPGWDDERAGCRPDVRQPSAPFRVERGDGAFYRATFDAAMASNPDWLYVNSFNEWVEGHYIEPSERFGNQYLDLTREFSAQFRR